MIFSRSFFVAFLALSVSAQAFPKQNNNRKTTQCAAPKTVTKTSTVTVTARGVGATATAKAGTATAKAGTATTKAGTNNGAVNTKTTAIASATRSAVGSTKTTAAATGNNRDPQKSTTLDPRVLASGFSNNGQDIPAAGQVPSLTSTNNFINFCLTVPNLPITNGKQITTGSCNPAPIGVIPSVDNMPSSKFIFPTNFATIKSNTTFTIQMAIQKMQTGFFVNAQENYFAAPQVLNAAGQIQGHSHVVVEQLTSLSQTTPTDPKKFVFFKGLNAAAVGGKLTADVTGGLAPGFYKLSSINSSSNHQPVIVPIAQHGSLDDAVYFTVTPNGQAAANPASGNVRASSTTKAANTAKATSRTANNRGNKGNKRRALNRMA